MRDLDKCLTPWEEAELGSASITMTRNGVMFVANSLYIRGKLCEGEIPACIYIYEPQDNKVVASNLYHGGCYGMEYWENENFVVGDDALDKLMDEIDEKLTADGYKLLTEEEAEKLSVLI